MTAKKFNKIVLAVLMILVLSFAMYSCNPAVVKPPEPDTKQPEVLEGFGTVELAFVSVSDIHFGSTLSSYAQHYYPEALRSAKSATGNRIDAVCVVGDFTEGFADNYDTLILHTRDQIGIERPLIAAYGNHEGDGKHNIYVEKFGKPVDNVTTVNGFTFIVVGAHAGNSYTAEQRTWLDGQLAAATALDPDKPVFVLIHHPLTGTHPINDPNGNLSSSTLRTALNKYPQTVVLTAHQHQRFSADSLWKGEFISFRNSYMQSSDYGQYAIIRVTDQNMIVIKTYSIKPGAQAVYDGESTDFVIDMDAYLTQKAA